MIAVVQRVTEASVTVATDKYRAEIGHGICVLLGVETNDSTSEAEWIARKLAHLRIFADQSGRMNESVQDVGGEILLVSQFTLAGDCRKGNRPTFDRAAPPGHGRALFDYVVVQIQEEHGVPVQTGIFGASMQVALVNDGPVTLIVERRST